MTQDTYHTVIAITLPIVIPILGIFLIRFVNYLISRKDQH